MEDDVLQHWGPATRNIQGFLVNTNIKEEGVVVVFIKFYSSFLICIMLLFSSMVTVDTNKRTGSSGDTKPNTIITSA